MERASPTGPSVRSSASSPRIKDEHEPAEARALLEEHAADLERKARRDEGRPAARARGRLGNRGGDGGGDPRLPRRRRSAQPLVVLVDDVQWAEPALLDLLAGLPAAIGDAPILLLCLGRPELLESRPDWQVTVQLEPFGERDVDALLEGLVGTAQADVRARLRGVGRQPALRRGAHRDARGRGRAAVAGRHLHARRRSRGPRPADEPPRLLGARLDRLEPDVRAALERGAIEGEVFHRGAVVELSPPRSRPSVPAGLEALVGKELIRPAEASFAGEAAFRFKHILVRDAAYQGTAKKLRGELHEQFAGWLERLLGSRVTEYEEILGYHLEQSYRYRTELGPVDDEAGALGARAAERLASAGRRAARRGDIDAASGLLGRASELLPPEHPARARIVVDHGGALMDASRNAEAARVFDELDGSRGVDEVSRALADVCRGEIELQLASTTASVDALHRRAHAAIELFAAHDDVEALLRACWVSVPHEHDDRPVGRSS